MLHPEIVPLVGSLDDALRCASVEGLRTPDVVPDWFLDQVVQDELSYAPLVSLSGSTAR